MMWNDAAPANPVNGYSTIVSNQARANLEKGTSGAICSELFFGNWADLVLGVWGGLDVIVNPYALDKRGGVRVTVLQDCDIAFRNTESFAKCVDITTT